MGNERVAINGMEDYLSLQQRRMNRQERRPNVSSAADILGPGFGPTATELSDWNAEEATFNGMFWSATGAINSPDGTRAWVGLTIAEDDRLAGMQRVWAYRVGTAVKEFTRRYSDDGLGNIIYTAWIGEGEWQTTGITPAGVAASINTQAWKRINNVVSISVSFLLNADVVGPANGNITNVQVAQVPTAIVPVDCPYVQAISMGNTGVLQGYTIDNLGRVFLGAVAPNTTTAAGQPMSLTGVYLL